MFVTNIFKIFISLSIYSISQKPSRSFDVFQAERGSRYDWFLSQNLVFFLSTFKIDVRNNKPAFLNSLYSILIARWHRRIILRLDRKSNATESDEDLPWRPKRHVTTRQHNGYIKVTHLYNRHHTTRATVGHILKHIFYLYGWDEYIQEWDSCSVS